MNGKSPGLRMTLATQLVLRAMLAEPTQEMYGLQICQAAELPSGTIHPILARLERLGHKRSGKLDAIIRPRAQIALLSAPGAD